MQANTKKGKLWRPKELLKRNVKVPDSSKELVYLFKFISERWTIVKQLRSNSCLHSIRSFTCIILISKSEVGPPKERSCLQLQRHLLWGGFPTSPMAREHGLLPRNALGSLHRLLPWITLHCAHCFTGLHLKPD